MLTRRKLFAAPLAVAGLARPERRAQPAVPPELVAAVRDLAGAIARLEAMEPEHAALAERSRAGDPDPLRAWYKAAYEPAVASMRAAEDRFRAALYEADLSAVVVDGQVWCDLNQCLPFDSDDIPESTIRFDLADVAGL